MKADKFDKSMKQVREIFTHAREIPNGPQRDKYLSTACGEDEILRKEVEELLSFSAESGNFLKCNVAGQPVAGPEELIGQAVGQYRIMDHIGHGGFADVYRVEQQEPIRRELAMKILRPGMGSQEIIDRFLRERELLTLMDHPNIAHIQDAGTTGDGRPYFVMDLVMGDPITKYCDRRKLAVQDRLELFKEACFAIQHAHQKGVLHRDLKPSNVIVIESDGLATVRIIDFGIAKSLEASKAKEFRHTHHGYFVGTPAYMSPEQISQGSDKVDSRSDIYSLGILLYELIAGVQPFEQETLQKAALAEIQRIICEVEPERPSVRLRKVKDRTVAIAESRALDTVTLIKTLRDDLDWIILKAIDKDRNQRYQGIGELVRDINFHLQNRPIEINGRGWPYRMKKFIRRHRMASTLILTIIPVFLVGLITSIIGFAMAKQKEEQGRISELITQVEAVKGSTFKEHFLTLVLGNLESRVNLRNMDFLFGQEDYDSGHPAREIVSKLKELTVATELLLKDHPEIKGRLLGLLADSYRSLDLKFEAWKMYKKMIDTLREHHGPLSIPYADGLVRYAQSINYGYFGQVVLTGSGYPKDFDWLLVQQGRPAEKALLEEAISIYRNQNHLSDTTIAAMVQLAGTIELSNPEKEALLNEIVAAGRNLYGEGTFRALFCEKQLGLYLINQGRLDEAKPFWIKLEDAVSTMADDPYWNPLTGTSGMGIILEKEGDYDGAEMIYRKNLQRMENQIRGEFSGNYISNLKMLFRLREKRGVPDEEVTAKLAKIGYRRGFDPTSCRVDYVLRINQPGTYRLYLKFTGHNPFSDSVCARLREQMDGFGGKIADFYGFSLKDVFAELQETQETIHRRSFEIPWQQAVYSTAFFEQPEEGLIRNERIPAQWTITEPGVYTLQFMEMESGTALDCFVFQLNSLPEPGSIEYQQSIRDREGIYTMTNGSVFIEAEDFTTRHPGRVTDWVVIPHEQDPMEFFAGASGRGYLQVLPEQEWIGHDYAEDNSNPPLPN